MHILQVYVTVGRNTSIGENRHFLLSRVMPIFLYRESVHQYMKYTKVQKKSVLDKCTIKCVVAIGLGNKHSLLSKITP